jgi:choline transport protein
MVGKYFPSRRIRTRADKKLVGWLCVLAWQSGMVLTAYSVAQQIQGIIALSNTNYVIQGWHGTLLTIATTIFCIFFNTVLFRRVPMIEGLALGLHILGFFTFIIVLWVMGPQAHASEVVGNFQDNNGWGNLGLATLVGLLSPITTLVGADAVCHLSEESRDASLILPKSMITTASINYVLGFIMTITFMFRVGDVDAALASSTGQPWMEVYLAATDSRGGTIGLAVIFTLLLLFCAINQVTTSSRQLFAFARDNGLPFSKFLSHVSARRSHY